MSVPLSNLDLTRKIFYETENIIISIKDSGCGMSKDLKEKVFDPFFTTNRANGNTGLGLYIVYNIVTQILEGTIECSSSPGNGVIFCISIPVD